MRHSPIIIANTIKTRLTESKLQLERPPKGSTPISFRVRLGLTVLLSGLMLMMGLFGIGGQSLSWAAPAQNPHLQTVPPRPPDDEPPPPESDLPAEAPASPSDRGDGDTTPTQPPEQQDNESQNESQPTQPPAPQDNGGQDTVQPTPNPKQESGLDQNQVSPAPPSQAEDEVDGASATFPQADLSLSQTVDNPTPNLGEVITFTITISNNGPSNATNVVMSDPLPLGLILSSTIPSQGSYNSGSGLWAVGTITYSESVTLSLVVTVTSAGTVTNTTEIAAAHPSDPDSTPGNGLEHEDDWDSVPIVTLLETSPTTQFGSDSVTFASASASASGSLFGWVGSLSWLYALCLGAILILSGIYLVNRA